MKKLLTTLAIMVTLSMGLLAQSGWKWPENKALAEENNVLYTDAVKMGDFKGAIVPLQWLISEAPDLNKALYIDGVKIYDNLAKVEKDAAQKSIYVDSILWMYDMRMKYFSDSVNVMNRKVFKAYRYLIKNTEKSEWLLDIYDTTYKISGNDVKDNNLLAYLIVIKANKSSDKNLTDEQILERYDVIINVIDFKVKALKAKGRSTDKILKQKNAIDKILTELVVIDCNFIVETMGPKFKASPDDIKLVKRMFSFMLTGKCTNSELFLEVSKQLQKLEPDYGLAKSIGLRCLASGDFACAEIYYYEALQLTEEGSQKAEVFLQMGKMAEKRKNKIGARQNYRKALAADPANKDSYVLIGDLYYRSFEQCKQQENMVDDRLIYIAAYEMYKRGGSTAKMHNAKSQFPSKEEIFTSNFVAGKVMKVGCWINESVALQSRD